MTKLHGYTVHQIMLNTFCYQLNVLITLRFLTLCASVGNKKCSRDMTRLMTSQVP